MAIVFKGISVLVLAHLLLLYVPITAIGLGSLLVVAGAGVFLDHKNLFALVCAVALLSVALEVTVRWLAPTSMQPYYRPHEMLALEKTYRPNQKVRVAVPHGDLLATDPMLPQDLAQPREEVFATDSIGYRNDQDFAQEKLLLVGDSFVAGIGNTQEDVLTMQLRRDYGINAYNLGFPADTQGYAERIAWARAKFPGISCIGMVLFEGNDFQLVNSAEVASRNAVPKGFQQVVKSYIRLIRGHSEFSKMFYGLTTRAWEVVQERIKTQSARSDARQQPSRTTFVKSVKGAPMGFLQGYADVVQRQTFDDYNFVRDRLTEAMPDFVLFVPDKYRIYSRLFEDSAVDQLPNAQWDYLSSVTARLRIPAVNLTDPLIERAQEIIPDGRTVFWRDDTHWNREGISVAAREVAKLLSTISNERCRADRL